MGGGGREKREEEQIKAKENIIQNRERENRETDRTRDARKKRGKWKRITVVSMIGVQICVVFVGRRGRERKSERQGERGKKGGVGVNIRTTPKCNSSPKTQHVL